MKSYKIKDGHIIDRETGETAGEIHGMLTAATVEETSGGKQYLHLVLGEGDEKASLRVKLYGLAALKILRCLYGTVATIGEAPVGISLEEVENAENIIHVTHGGRDLPALGGIPAYPDHRDLLIQRLLGDVKAALESRFPVAVLTVAGTRLDDPTAGEAVDAIRNARTDGRAISFTKKVYSNPAAAAAFLAGARAASGGNAYIIFGAEDIETIETVVNETGQVPATTEPVDPEDNEEA